MLATSYPSAILAREGAIIVNLEFIKMTIGLEKCYITNLDDPNTEEFVEELQRRLKYGPTHVEEQQSHMARAVSAGSVVGKFGRNVGGGLPSSRSYSVMPPLGPLPELPFELRVLETALDYISKYLEQQTSDLEAATHPALDALTQKISTSNLERVRRIKNRMVRLNTRVETVRCL